MSNDIKITLLNVELVAGWSLDTNNTFCTICDGKLILPPKNKKIRCDMIVENDRVIVGECEHAYHESCLNEFGDFCFEDNLIFKENNTIKVDLDKIVTYTKKN